ncbi:hypothetical protein A3A39_03485 [Candidatus Kaiserbacteria bacterium RIFCSPLOWO2_01_FULL_54_13]|uniref:Uncharacterized protein n=1 Tax=Candidatus Kaiserbacteria bacterium RIFCSPLOWO2_01_FULL_54_13 TaxID=1798512 RepID=A0A1F6F384_9BACT|nr:MAG: hypothetical protein A3A39_03485 [Candidatus Kaiserbacteria bacterium RIFCSPLOWO2_01_FULL_54_13]
MRHVRAVPFVVLALAFVIAVAYLDAVPTLSTGLRNAYEDISYKLAPSAEKAFKYGERHFDSRHPAAYDINRAEYFFERAAAEDPTIPYLYHEFARISFLKKNFKRALGQINFQIGMHGKSARNSFYVRGLIEGYMGRYEEAARDFKVFLEAYPRNWAAVNDYAWVLLKSGRTEEAIEAVREALKYFPDNPWLLNTYASALYEIGDLDTARFVARSSATAAMHVSENDWLTAYPGNDPAIARTGLIEFQDSIRRNMHTILLTASKRGLQ